MALQLYKKNIVVSRAFLPLSSMLEVVLRNGINEALISYFSDCDWIINQKTGFMSDSSLTYYSRRKGKFVKNDFLLTEVTKAEKRLLKAQTKVSSSKVIAEQTFGFWTDLFEIQHYKLLKGRPIQTFKHLPPGHGRKEAYDALNKIRLFRNRIYHNEPICFDSKGSVFHEAIAIHRHILDVFHWVEPDIEPWIKDLDEVLSSINNPI